MKTKFYLRTLLAIASMTASIALCGQAKDVKVIAHRGYWTTEGAAQNSVTALTKAAEAGCFGSEFDVWMTADSVLVVDHDGVINGHNIQRSPSEIILSQKLKNGEKVPTLEQYFEEAVRHPTLRLICEIKTPDSRQQEQYMTKKICEMAKSFGVENRMVYISFSKDGMVNLKRFAPKGTEIYYLTGDYVPRQLKHMELAGADYNYGVLRLHPEWIRQLHDMDLKVNAWTVDTPEEWQWCIENDVDFITTNHPAALIEFIKEYDKSENH